MEKLLEIIKDTLIAGEDVMISGFGKWTVKQKHARRGRNPKTGAIIDVRPKKLPFFKVGKELKAMVDTKDNLGSPK